MREMQTIVAEKRAGTGKGPAYQARQKGHIPAVVYGGDAEPENVSIEARSLERHAVKGTFLSTLFTLEVGGAKTRVIPRQIQLDPVSDRPVHVDFMRLPEGAKVRLSIPVRFKGQGDSPGLKRGGVLNIVRHEIEMLCPAEHIPEFVEGDLAGLNIHDSLHIGNIALPEGVVPTVRERNFTIASIVAPTSVVEEQRAAAAAATAAASAPVVEEAAAPAAGAAAPAAAKAPEKK
ncbi:MAG TPA: 50S ribosomal protein L25/general stress protein Ctc [Rhizomicrobium sp.]|jgi:large subunit ribosomal protein L25